tara:strand:- start:501 stop:818 length:318 start_codon:yes stop_codon:yes gene_type:complete
MKNFVFNFFSEDKSKLLLGNDLFNLVSTALIFDQSVTLILNSFEEKFDKEYLLFLSNVDAIQGKLRVVIDKKKLAQNTNLYENIELLTSYEINNLIIEADYYTKC